jgi:hypothetical protein
MSEERACVRLFTPSGVICSRTKMIRTTDIAPLAGCAPSPDERLQTFNP